MKKSEFIEEYIRRVKAYRNAPSYCEHPFEVSDEGCRDLALNAAEQAEEAGVPWDPEVNLRPCPNPECVLDAGVELEFSSLGGAVAGCWVNCNDCSLSGPYSSASDEAEAIRLWNLLPRTQDEVPAGDPGEREGGELPERLCMEVDEPGVGIIDQADRMWLDLTLIDEELPLSLTEREKLKELLARYNAWEILHQRARSEWPRTTLVAMDRHLAEEREKLR